VENEEELTPNPINKKKDRAKKVQEVKSPSETDVNQSVVGNGSSSDSSFTDKSAPVDVPGGAEEEVIQTIPANNNAPGIYTIFSPCYNLFYFVFSLPIAYPF